MTMDTRPRSPMDDVASGQRMLILAILVNIVALVARGAGADWLVFGPVSVLAGVAAVFGLLRMTNGLGATSGMQVVLVILVFIPVVSLITLAMVNSRATKALRAAGYEVGFLGARPKRETA